jgi:hypothetical protein
MRKIGRNSVRESDLEGANTVAALLTMGAELHGIGEIKGTDDTCVIYRHPDFPGTGFCYNRENRKITHIGTFHLPERELPVMQVNAMEPMRGGPVTESDMENVKRLGKLLGLGARYIRPNVDSDGEFVYGHPGIPGKEFCYRRSGMNLNHVWTL